jgi:tRNA isopentenyl-2-thiomethyl-A-37 hydroxylase MiaE
MCSISNVDIRWDVWMIRYNKGRKIIIRKKEVSRNADKLLLLFFIQPGSFERSTQERRAMKPWLVAKDSTPATSI